MFHSIVICLIELIVGTFIIIIIIIICFMFLFIFLTNSIISTWIYFIFHQIFLVKRLKLIITIRSAIIVFRIEILLKPKYKLLITLMLKSCYYIG